MWTDVEGKYGRRTDDNMRRDIQSRPRSRPRRGGSSGRAGAAGRAGLEIEQRPRPRPCHGPGPMSPCVTDGQSGDAASSDRADRTNTPAPCRVSKTEAGPKYKRGHPRSGG